MAEINDKIRFDFTGATETWKVPKHVKRIKIEVYGARGGGAISGYGGKAWGELPVTEGQVFYITVGEMPSSNVGGYNGGGRAGANGSGSYAGSGGGATDVRLGGTSLSDRIIVAGGGGGGAYAVNGGGGGGLTGGNGAGVYYGGGGTQSSGGVNDMDGVTNATVRGTGGYGMMSSHSSYYGGGGGGGGYYGGAGGYTGSSGYAGSGGGGSAYTGNLSKAGTSSGVNTGNGYALITILEMDYAEFTIHNDISNVSDGNKILEYTLDSNHDELTVVEKIDSVVVATKTLKSGERNTLSIPKEQWDSLAYGNYRSRTSEFHTITLENKYNTANFNFTKSIPNEAGLSEILKSIEDANNAIIPSIKTKLATKSEATKEATFEDLIAGITLGKLGGRKWASGTQIFDLTSNVNEGHQVLGLDFKPTVVVVYSESNGEYGYSVYVDNFGDIGSVIKQDLTKGSGNYGVQVKSAIYGTFVFIVRANGFSQNGATFKWLAIG